MNQLPGKISFIETAEAISLVTIMAYGKQFYSLVLDTTDTASYLQVGQEIIMVFKETEMSVGKNLTGVLSLGNQFPSVIQTIRMGKVLTSLTLKFESQLLGAIITTRSAHLMNLAVGDQVVGLVKTNEVSLTTHVL